MGLRLRGLELRVSAFPQSPTIAIGGGWGSGCNSFGFFVPGLGLQVAKVFTARS